MSAQFNHLPPTGPNPSFSHYNVQRPPNNFQIGRNFTANRTMVPFSRPQNSIRPEYLNPRNPSTYRTVPSGPILRSSEPWEEWSELTIRIYGLDPKTNTWELWNRFQEEGTIIFIELFDNKQGRRENAAQIRFAPPPARAFWNNPVSMPTKDLSGSYQVQIELLPRKRSFQIQSPVRASRWYPESTMLSPSGLDFGFMLEDMTMMKMFTINTIAEEDELTLKIDLLRMRVTCTFTLEFTNPDGNRSKGQYDRIRKYMFQIPFVQLQKVYRVEIDESHWALILILDSPPQFFRKQVNDRASHHEDAPTWSEFDTWYRQTDIVYNPNELKDAIVALNRAIAPVIDIGRWTTYRLIFDDSKVRRDLYEQVKEALHDFNIEIVNLENFSTQARRTAGFWSVLDPSIPQDSDLSIESMLTESGNATIELPFEVRYQLEVCISQGILNEHNIDRDFLTKLAHLAENDQAKARDILEYIAERAVRIYDPMSIFEDVEALAYSTKRTIPHYCEFARKATVTPTAIYFSTPSVETSNRVIRNYSHYGDRFLRVQFTDEKYEGRINSSADKARNDQLYTRIFRTLANGIRIGSRHYQFLAFGNSQFRENGAYFFCPVDQVTCGTIRQWMGNFSELRIPAKYAARLGQCFSTTRAIRSTRVRIVEIPDVKRNGYCFTDGVGKISEFLAKMIASELGLPSTSPVPCAFQFRLGGCKGILAISPDARGQEVHIRESQQKFKAVYNGLEIIRCSRYSAAALNRQTITILSALGVPDRVFTRMLTQQLSDYQSAMTDETLALDLLRRYIDDNHMTITIAGLICDGFMSQNEPFMVSLLHLWRSWSIKLLKEKAKIMVENGAFLLGCTDETGTLRGHQNKILALGYNVTEEDLPEIFVSVPDKNDPGRYIVVEGICLIGRNPSLHPGDIRVVRAVDVPALRNLRDVVVFAQQGDRDVPGMCSGGDLDGDDFFVIWDHDLTPNEWNVEPMNYTAPKGEELDQPVQIRDLMTFFVRYMKNDALSIIAHAHLAQSDYLDQSVKDRKCLALAELHSKAVDYVKSGVSAEMPKNLRPRRWPHFMEKNYKPKEQIYVSEKILGQLYDLVERVDFVPQYDAPFDKRILKAYELHNSMLKDARHIKVQYDNAMRRILAQEEIKTEFEIWSSFVLSKPRVGSDYKVQEHIGNISGALKDRFRQICIEKAGGKDFKELGPFVAAMYRVTSEEMQIALHECRSTKVVGGKEVPKRTMDPKSMPLMSFPWLFHEILGRIATGIEAREDFEELDPFATTAAHTHSREKYEAKNSNEDLDFTDFVQTAEGITHRGEILDLFKPDDVDSEGDPVEQPFRTRSDAPLQELPSEFGVDDEISELNLDMGRQVFVEETNEETNEEASEEASEETNEETNEEADEEAGEEVFLDNKQEESALAKLARMVDDM